MEDHFDTIAPSKFSPAVEAILIHLYENPQGDTGTASLVEMLNLKQSEAQQQFSFDDIQEAIEDLIFEDRVRGKRLRESGRVQHVKLRLTPKGEKVAIAERRRARGTRVNIVNVAQRRKED
jgi:hypothetical protein